MYQYEDGPLRLERLSRLGDVRTNQLREMPHIIEVFYHYTLLKHLPTSTFFLCEADQNFVPR